MTELMKFDYDSLDSEARIVVRQKTGEIHERVETMKRSAIEIGQRLIEVKAQLPYGAWGKWLEAEFGWTDQTALNFMSVAHMNEKNPKLLESEDQFARSALFALAGKNVPDAARDEALQRAEQGEHIGVKQADQIITSHKAPKFKLGQKVRYSGGIYQVSGITSGGHYTLRPLLIGTLKNDVLEEQIEALDSQEGQANPPPSAPVHSSKPTTDPASPTNPAAPHPPSLTIPAAPQEPTATPSIQVEIAEKLTGTNLHPFRIVTHTNGHSGTFSAGFNSKATTRKQADEEAKTYAELMQMLGFVVLNAGVDIPPGYQTLSMSGQHTPIVYFALPGYQMPELAGTGKSVPDGDEWYTPSDVIERVREFFGGDIDLDPASCAAAQQTVKALTYFDAEHDGLAHEWHGRAWMNPPYSIPLVQQFTAKLIAEYRSERVTEAIALTNNRTDADWCQQMMAAATAVCFSKRINFDHPIRDSNGNRQGQIFFYFGSRPFEFARTFHDFGVAMDVLYMPEASLEVGSTE